MDESQSQMEDIVISSNCIHLLFVDERPSVWTSFRPNTENIEKWEKKAPSVLHDWQRSSVSILGHQLLRISRINIVNQKMQN